MPAPSTYAPFSWLGTLYVYNQRVWLPIFSGTTAVHGGVVTSISNVIGRVALLPTQALRIVKTSVAVCLDPNNSNSLSCEAVQIKVEDSFNNTVMAFPGTYSGTLMGQTGVATTAESDEVLLPSDYASGGGDQKNFSFNVAADVLNKDLTNDHVFNIAGGVLYEIWQQPTTIAHVGYP